MTEDVAFYVELAREAPEGPLVELVLAGDEGAATTGHTIAWVTGHRIRDER